MVYSGVSLLSLQQEVLNGVITWQLPTVPNVPVSIKFFVHLLHWLSIYFLAVLLSMQ